MAERIAAAKGKAWHTSEQDNQISGQWRTLEGGAPSVNRQRQNAAVVLQFRPQVVQFAQNHFPVLEERCLSEMDTCPLVTVIHNKKNVEKGTVRENEDHLFYVIILFFNMFF